MGKTESLYTVILDIDFFGFCSIIERMVKIINLNKSVYADNDARADEARRRLKDKGVYLVNVMSSPGAGKTTALISVINGLSRYYNVGVMEADIDSDVDAVKVSKLAPCRAIQLHTGGMCHLDADMTMQGIDELGVDGLDVVFLENVGNLVCPAEFDTGAHLNVIIASVPEGDDKPLKYPLAYSNCQLVILNKIDSAPYFTFNKDAFYRNVRTRNRDAEIIPISAKTGENVSSVTDYLRQKISDFKENEKCPNKTTK